MKKMNILIIGLILVILFLLLGCKNNEGFVEGGRDPATGLPTTFGNVTDLTGQTLTSFTPSLTSLTSLTLSTNNVLAHNANAEYCAFIDTGTVAKNSLKIAKKVLGTWKVIWSSELSDPLWVGPSVTFTPATTSELAKITIGTTTTIGSTIGSAIGGTSAKLNNNGDLVIVKTVSGGEVTLWSLASHELQSTKIQLNEYLNRGSRIYASTELESLKKKLTNFSKYITAVALNPADTTQAEKLKEAHAMIVQARHQMDFDLSELNGVANSKVVSSQNGLNSSLYVNLMATTLAAGLFILIATR